MSLDGQGTKRRRKIAENFNRLSTVHERYRQTDRQTHRQTTEGRATAYSEREFTFAKNYSRGPRLSIVRPRAKNSTNTARFTNETVAWRSFHFYRQYFLVNGFRAETSLCWAPSQDSRTNGRINAWRQQTLLAPDIDDMSQFTRLVVARHPGGS